MRKIILIKFKPNHLFISALFLLILSSVLPTSALNRDLSFSPRSPSGEEVKGNQWLFVIGINSYINWPRLKTAVNDAKAVKDVLLERYYFNKSHVIELYDENATEKNIIKKLRHLAKNVKSDDSLLIYYAGHGYIDPITKEGKWIPVESGIQDTSSWISNHDIKNYLRTDVIKANHVLLISDSCFSGDFFRGKRGKLPKVTDEVIKRAYKLSSRQAITSGGLEPVSDAGFGNNSVFTHFLVKTLKENQKPYLIPSEFFPDIRAGVSENAEQFPQLGSLKDTGGQQGGELVLFLKQEEQLSKLSKVTEEKRAELDRLAKLEKESRKAKEKEQAEIAQKEKELARLDKEILVMKKRLGSNSAKTGDSLDAMFAMVKQKEEQDHRLSELKRKREEEERKRRKEIERLKREQYKKKKKAVGDDIKKYEEIVNSKYGKEMKEMAWNSLIEKYPDAGGVEYGNLSALKAKLGIIEGMVFIKGGCFDMGDTFGDGYDDEKPVHEVCVDDFYMGEHEVTQKEWKEVTGNNPSEFKNCGDDCPVESVSWNDVQEYIRKLNNQSGLNYRLPTEAEWEYAAREGGKRVKFSGFSDERDLSLHANFCDVNCGYDWKTSNQNDGYKNTSPVKSFRPNSLGLHDMTGNVWEWVSDWYDKDYYRNSPRNNPIGPRSGEYRVLRGGSWDSSPKNVRAANRIGGGPDDRAYSLGFRVAQD